MEELSKVGHDSIQPAGMANQEQPMIDMLRLKMIDVQKMQKSNNDILEMADKELSSSGHRVNELTSWYIKRPASKQRRFGIHHEIIAAKRTKVDLEDHLDTLHQARELVINTSQKISSEIKPVAEGLGKLQSDIEGIDDHDAQKDLLQNFHEQEALLRQLDQSKRMLLEQAVSQKERLDEYAEMLRGPLRETTEHLHTLEQQKPAGHLYFPEEEMLPAKANNEFIPRGRFPGGCVVNVVRTLLKAQGVDVSDERHIAETLGIHPLGGGIDVRKLHEVLPSLGDRLGYQFWIIKPKDLDITLKKKPIGAFLFSKDIGGHAVTLDHRERHIPTNKSYVVALDQLRDEPYKISVDTFATAWNGGVLLPKSAIQSYLRVVGH